MTLFNKSSTYLASPNLIAVWAVFFLQVPMYYLLAFIVFGFSFSICSAQTDTPDTLITARLPSTGTIHTINTLPQVGELNEVRFIGNVHFSNSDLQDVISTLPSDLSFAHRIFRFYYRQLKINPFTPNPLEDALGVAVKNYEEEYRYFDQTGAENDVTTLIDVYNQYGFHNATASYSFDFDSTTKENILTFSINENNQYTIDTVLYTGLETLPSEIQSDLHSLLPTFKGTYFNEPALKNTVDAISSFLQNHGYYFAHYEQPIVHSSPFSVTDSIIIPFSLGQRCKIGKIHVKSDFNTQNPISDYLTRQMLEIHTDDWYSRAAINLSQSNLYSLTTFDLVSIDTIDVVKNDSITHLSFQVFLRYKKQKEVVIAPFLNHTTYDNFTNLGIEGSFLHRNLFGAAQSASFFTKIMWQYYSFPYNFTSTEYQLGFQFSQPMLWEPFGSKMGFSVQSSFSNRSIFSGLSFQHVNLSLSTVPIRFSFPFTLSSYTFFNSALVDVSFEWSKLDNYDEVNLDMRTNIDYSRSQDSVQKDINDLDGFMDPYNRLNLAHSTSWGFLGIIISGALTGDTRNNPFSPTKGYYFSISTDFAFAGLYNIFIRPQASCYFFIPTGVRNVLAFKFKVGHIYDPSSFTKDPYIPPDKRFFAGGSNSIRSYESRTLSDRTSGLIEGDGVNYLGCASIIEGSVEYRYRFPKFRDINSTLAEQIEQMGITFFLDWGNTYNQLSTSKYNSATISDIFKGIAVGIGIGFRRETPVGPIRIDLATQFYDPQSPNNQLIFSRSPLSSDNLKLHIGLGHAF